MIKLAGVESCKILAELLADLIPGGAVFGLVEKDTFVWVKETSAFRLDVIKVGNKLHEDTTTMRSIREKRVLTENIPRAVFGKRVTLVSIPVLNDDGDAVGALSVGDNIT